MENSNGAVAINIKALAEMFSTESGMGNEYTFFMDFRNDYCCISGTMEENRSMSVSGYWGTLEQFMSFIYKPDYIFVENELNQAKNGNRKNYEIKFRCLSMAGDICRVSLFGKLCIGEVERYKILMGRMSIVRRSEIGIIRGINEFELDFRRLEENLIYQKALLIKAGISDWSDLTAQYSNTVCQEIYNKFYCDIVSMFDEHMSVYQAEDGEVIMMGVCDLSPAKVKDRFKQLRKQGTTYQDGLGNCIYYMISAGCKEFYIGKDDFHDILKKTEFVFQAAKSNRRNFVEFFNEDKYGNYIKILNMKEELKYDVSNHFLGFEVFYQPIVSGDLLIVTGAEALLRWKSQKYGNISPAEFVPLLEETGLIIPVGKWVLSAAMMQCKRWQEYISHFRMNVNLSHIQLKQSDISGELLKNLEKCKLDSKDVMLELTESGFVEKDAAVRRMIKHFQKMKVKLAIDDFGTGYSNFSYLKDLRVHIIKIDRTFVSNSLASNYQFKLLWHLIEMAHEVQLKVCLEGIETEEELKRILELKPDFIQGFYFGKPVSAETFSKDYFSVK